MRSKQTLLFLFMLILSVSLAACDDLTITAPVAETAVESPALTEEGAAAPQNEAYPAPADSPDTADLEAYPAPAESPDSAELEAYPAPAESSNSAELEAYPAPAESSNSAELEAYPAPAESSNSAEPEAYPAPETEEAAAAPEENTLLPQPQSPATLTNRVWTLQQFDNKGGESLLPAPGLAEINTIEFFEDGRVSIIAGCNVARGAYSAAAGAINIQAVNQTHETCEDTSLGGQFLQWINMAGSFRINGESLVLDLPDGAGEMQLLGSDILTFGDQYSKLLVMVSSLGLPEVQPETLDELMDASLDKLVYQKGDPLNQAFGKAPGAVVLIQSPQGSMVKASGLADVEDKKLMAAFDRLEIGSNTKMFTGVLLAQLQEEGLLSLDDPLSKWLPLLAADITNGEAITLRHLATHSSGIPDYGDIVIGAGAADSEALRSGYTPEELVRIAIESAPPDFAPGEPGRWKYSNTGYILLGMVLEAASGQSYGDLLQQRIFEPLQMDNSELLEGVPYPNSVIDGYFMFPYDINTTEWNGSQGWAAGGIISTAGDMAKFARALMTAELFQDPATLDEMTRFIEVSQNEEVGSVGGTGYGIGLIEFAPGFWGHRGQTVGFTSIVAMDPAKDFILIALTNSAEASVGDEQQLMGHFLHLDQE